MRMRFLVICVLLAGHVGAADFTIAVRGQNPDCVIVLPAASTPSQQYAAEELRDYVRKLTGVTLNVTTNAIPVKQIRIAAGEADLGDDGFHLFVDGNVLNVTGGRRGVLYGVYELLETYGGIGWYTSDFTLVPEKDLFTVPAGLNVREKPAFLLREAAWYDWLRSAEFAAHCRVNGANAPLGKKFGGPGPRFGGGLKNCHTFRRILDPEIYFDSHPEYFSEVNGIRLKNRTQLCLTNPDVLAIVTSNVLARIRSDPDATFYGVSQNDWDNYCTCARCKAVDEEECSHAGSILRFVNAVAEAVEREFPDKIIETLAYTYSRKPPRFAKPRKNVMICLCTIECDFAHPLETGMSRENVEFRNDFDAWAQIAGDRLYVWDYTVNFMHYLHAFPNLPVLRPNLSYFHRKKVSAIYEQGNGQGLYAHCGELKTWLLAKLMWNPDRPIAPLIDRFLQGYYGDAAPFVREYLKALHALERPDSPNRRLWIYESVADPLITDQFLQVASKLWSDAETSVVGDPVRRSHVRSGSAWTRYTMERRIPSFGRYCLAKDLKALLPRFERKRKLAGELLALKEEFPQMRICEPDEQEKATLGEWRAALNCKLPVRSADHVYLAADDLVRDERGDFSVLEREPRLGGTNVIRLLTTHHEWCVRAYLKNFVFDADSIYGIRVNARVVGAGPGDAFSAGIYRCAQNAAAVSNLVARCDGSDAGYRWYELPSWSPNVSDLFWIAPVEEDKGGAHAIYIAGIEVFRNESSNQSN